LHPRYARGCKKCKINPMGFLQTLAALPEAVLSWFRPVELNSIRALRQAGSAIGILAESFSTDADEWHIQPGRLERKGVEVTWKGKLPSPRTRVQVKIDGKTVRMYASEGEVLKEAVAELIGKKAQQ
jgi:hypothetical protein